MNAIKKVKRRFSIKKDTDHDPDYSADEADEETHRYIQKEIEDAEKHGHAQGKPGGFLNKLIAHGNRKTEAQLAAEAELRRNNVQGVDYASARGGDKGGDGVVR